MKVLFICAENTCRSQMAEGFARALGIDAESAGIKSGAGVNPTAVSVMKECGIDISGHLSKAIDPSSLSRFDMVVSLCHASTADVCPSTFLGAQENWNVEDPWQQPLAQFRLIRDEIRARVEGLAKVSRQ